MTRRQARIADWPFPADQEILLIWLRSPHRVMLGGKQWRTVATFVPLADGATPRNVELPWGMLPVLQPGISYLDGYIHRQLQQGEEHDIFVRQAGTLATARECFGSISWIDLLGEDGDEFLFILETLQGRYFLPVPEAIRVLLAPNKTLALGLLEADYLARVVADNHIVTHIKPKGEERVLHLRFIDEIVPAALDRNAVRHVGRLLYDSSFRRAWDAVERERHRRTGTAGPAGELPRVPLRFPLPELRDHWRVRASPVGENAYLIAEILSVTATMELPFSNVIYTTPDLTRTVRRSVAPGIQSGYAEDSTDANGQKETRLRRRTSLSATALPPRDSRRPRRAGTVSYGLRGDESISVRRQADKEKIRKTLSSSAEGSGKLISNPALSFAGITGVEGSGNRSRRVSAPSNLDSPPAEEISLGAAAPNGELAPGEYDLVSPDFASESKLRPLPLKCQPHDGLDAFASALETLGASGPPLQITWYVDQLTSKGSYARMGSQSRRYALVRCAGGSEPPCWLLEFAQLDRRAPSTLILFPIGCVDFEALRRFITDEILVRALQPKGWWDWLELMKLHSEQRLRFAFLRHESLEPEQWAEQLQRKIKTARQTVWLPVKSIC